MVVDLNEYVCRSGRCSRGRVADSLSVLCAIVCAFRRIAAGGSRMECADARHVLPHRTGVIVFICVVEEVVVMAPAKIRLGAAKLKNQRYLSVSQNNSLNLRLHIVCRSPIWA